MSSDTQAIPLVHGSETRFYNDIQGEFLRKNLSAPTLFDECSNINFKTFNKQSIRLKGKERIFHEQLKITNK